MELVRVGNWLLDGFGTLRDQEKNKDAKRHDLFIICRMKKSPLLAKRAEGLLDDSYLSFQRCPFVVTKETVNT